jgi:hypothetical protein
VKSVRVMPYWFRRLGRVSGNFRRRLNSREDTVVLVGRPRKGHSSHVTASKIAMDSKSHGALEPWLRVDCYFRCLDDDSNVFPSSRGLVAWGQMSVPPISPHARFLAVATGDSHTVVLNEDGTATGWGANTARELVSIPEGLSNMVSIVAGGGGASGDQA